MRLQSLLPEHEIDAAIADLEVSGVALDSRKVTEGDIFFALGGTHIDGARFASQAARDGAAVIVASHASSIDPDLTCPVIRVNDPARALAQASTIAAGPQPEIITGVTGTSGKSSVVHFLRQIWQAQGLNAASVGTLGITTASSVDHGGLTTPDAVSLHRTLARLARDGISAVALEASSHGLLQRRLDGITFAAAAFTNLGRDHMDYHPTTEDYLAAKMRLFDTLLPIPGKVVIDADGAMSGRVAELAAGLGHQVFSIGERGSSLKILARDRQPHGQKLRIAMGSSEANADREFDIDLPLIGDFQASNALVAAGLAIATGAQAETALSAIEDLTGAPGRMEFAGMSRAGASVYVDYAHKPDALRAVLAALRPYTRSKLIVVFGAGGDRDPGKRPLMGEAARQLADDVIVTDDNPRTEDPALIRQAILAAVPEAREIGDRQAAIRQAIDDAGPGDIVVIAGKGHEQGQIVGDRTLPFEDRAEARAALDLVRMETA